jgi:hypothetical protein
MAKTTAFLSIFFIATLLLTFCSALPVHADPEWNIQTVDSSTFSNAFIALDSNGTLHVAYTHVFSFGRNLVYGCEYARWNGSAWNSQNVVGGTVINVTYFGTVFPIVSNDALSGFALDAHDNPNIIYNPGNGGLMYAGGWATAAAWLNQTIDPHGESGSLAFDSHGALHIAYFSNGAVKYARWNTTGLDIQTVDSSETSLSGISLGFSNSTPYIMYGCSQGLKLAVWNNSSWSIQTAASNVIGFGNMVMDSSGYPHFTCIKSSLPTTLTYVSWNGSGWTSQVVGTNGSVSDAGYLAIDSHGYPHIDVIVSTPNGTALTYTSWTGINWDIQTVGPNSTAVQDGPLAIDSNGNPHIIYFAPTEDTYCFICLSATATDPTPIFTPSPTPTSSPTLVRTSLIFSASPLLFVLTAVVIIAVVVVGLIFHVKKHKPTAHRIIEGQTT